MSLQRRKFLEAAGMVSGVALAHTALPVYAKAPFAGTQITSVHRIKLGNFEVTSLLDGYIEIDPRLLNASPDMVKKLMEAANLPYGPVRTPVNAFLVNTGEKLVLLDTGGAKFLGPTAGRLLQGLSASGVDPDQVDEIYITHMHGDHLHGAVTPEGKSLFPKAVLRVSQQDADYWLSPEVEAAAPEAQKWRFVAAKRAKAAYGERFQPFKQGDELTPGITAVAAVGHTPGHTCFLVSSGSAKLLAVGDLIHVAPVQFSNPEVTISFDWQPAVASTARQNLFDRAVKENMLIAAVHLPFPGLGTLSKDGGSYAYAPLSWRLF